MYVYNNIYFVQRIPVPFIKRNYIQNGQYVMLNVGDQSLGGEVCDLWKGTRFIFCWLGFICKGK